MCFSLRDSCVCVCLCDCISMFSTKTNRYQVYSIVVNTTQNWEWINFSFYVALREIFFFHISSLTWSYDLPIPSVSCMLVCTVYLVIFQKHHCNCDDVSKKCSWEGMYKFRTITGFLCFVLVFVLFLFLFWFWFGFVVCLCMKLR